MRIECDKCNKVFDDTKITLVVVGENAWGHIFREYLCNKCLKEHMKDVNKNE